MNWRSMDWLLDLVHHLKYPYSKWFITSVWTIRHCLALQSEASAHVPWVFFVVQALQRPLALAIHRKSMARMGLRSGRVSPASDRGRLDLGLRLGVSLEHLHSDVSQVAFAIPCFEDGRKTSFAQSSLTNAVMVLGDLQLEITDESFKRITSCKTEILPSSKSP